MKKYLLVLSIVLSVLIMKPINVSATSGACSSHGGVNCSVISISDNNAICNDGWKSSTSYYNTIECTENNSSCFAPIKSGCTSDFDLGVLNKQSAQNGMMQYGSSMYDNSVSLCKNQIAEYQNQMADYNTCMNKVVNPPTPITVKSTEDYANDLNTKMQEYCIGKYGNNSLYNNALSCTCKSGYAKEFNLNNTSPNASLDFQCKLENEVCTDSRATYNQTTSKCECKSQAYDYINGKCEFSEEKAKIIIKDIVDKVKKDSNQNATIKKTNNLKIEDFAPVKSSSDFQVQDQDIEPFQAKGVIKNSTAFRKCPSKDCTIIRYYAETSKVNIIGKYKKDSWYEIAGSTDAGSGIKINGWINQSVFDQVSSIESTATPATSALDKLISENPKEITPTPLPTKPLIHKNFFNRVFDFIKGIF